MILGINLSYPLDIQPLPTQVKNKQKSSLTTIILTTIFSFLDGRHVPQQPEQPQQRRLPMLLHRHIRKLLNFHLNNFLLNRYLKQLLNFHLNKCFANRHIKKVVKLPSNNVFV
jgi:hypothetical protein